MKSILQIWKSLLPFYPIRNEKEMFKNEQVIHAFATLTAVQNLVT